MQQLTYTINGDFAPSEMYAQVLALPAFTEASSRVQLVFEPEGDLPLMQDHLSSLQNMPPNTITVGMTTLGAVDPEIHTPEDAISTFLLFEHSEAHLHVYDCHVMTPDVAGKKLVEELANYENVRGVLCISSCAHMCPAPFVDRISQAYPTVPVFGTQAGTRNLAHDHSVFFANGTIYDKGILAIVFCGESLHVNADYNLGWRPIGKEFVISGYEGNGMVSTIDESPAASIYRRYLNVIPDEHFYSNVCAFPLLMPSGRRMIARVPLSSTHDGMLQFSMTVDTSEHVRFSYTKPEYLLQNSLAAANAMAEFQPQSLILFACVNRRVFLGDERADREFGYYKSACPSMTWAYGYGEILRTSDGGGILNSSIVAVGMREGELASPAPQPLLDPSLAQTSSAIPLPERLITFLEETTSELYDTISELEMLVERDQLTGIYNRRRMDELIRYELSKRYDEDTLVLLMYDIDFFKRVNDTHGHDTGDIILKDLTKCVQGVIRAADTLGRWGGEEFLCLLTNTSLRQACVVAERIRSRIEQTNFPQVGRVTVSIGMTCAKEGDTPETLFTRADKALYDAKHAGRNCVAIR